MLQTSWFHSNSCNFIQIHGNLMKLLTDALLTSYIVHEKRAHFAVVFYFWSMIQTFPLLNEMFWFFLFLETATFFLLHVFLWLRCFFSLNFLLIWWKSKFSVATPYKLHHGLLVSGNNQENQTSFRMCYMEWNKATLIGMSGNGQFGIIFVWKMWSDFEAEWRIC